MSLHLADGSAPVLAIMQKSPWFLRQSGGPGRLRLFCFSYAGGSASAYRFWHAALPSDIEVCAVQLPGRETRFAEPPLRSWPLLIGALSREISQSVGSMPFAFFGHSLGATVAFEVARHLAASRLPQPKKLFVSASGAPQLRLPPKGLHALPEADLIREVSALNGTPMDVLRDPDIMNLWLPIARADFFLAESYRYQPGELLNLPIHVYAGTQDERTNKERAEGWQMETRSDCTVRWFEGGHFFINEQRDAVLNALSDDLSATQSRPVREHV